MKKLIVVVFFSVLMIIVSLNAVSIKQALINYQRGESNRQFWLEQSMVSLALAGFKALLIPVLPPLLAPFYIAQVAGLGIAGGAGVIHNRPEWMRNIVGNDTSIMSETIIPQSEINGGNINPPQANLILPHLHNTAPSQELIIPRVTQPLPIKPELPSVSAPGENIFAALLMAAIAGAGYKFYQWYNAPKEDKPVEQIIEPLKKEV